MIKKAIDALMKDRPSPSYPILPRIMPGGRSTIPGLYLAGDVAGKPLIKIALNDGYELGLKLSEELKEMPETEIDYDVIVAGAGVAGMAAAVRLHELGHKVMAIDSGQLFQTLRTFTKGKLMLAEPVDMDLKGSIPFEESSIEQTLEWFEKAVADSGVEYKEYTKITDVKQISGGFNVKTERGEFTSRLIVLSTGKSGNPRKAGAPGELEFPEKTAHFLKDPDDFKDKKLLVYGGGDVAAEAAVALSDTNDVTLVTIDEEFIFPMKKNVDAMQAKEKEGKLAIRMNTGLSSIGKENVIIKNLGTGKEEVLPNDFVFEMIGSEVPTGFFKKIGIKMESVWDTARWLLLTAMLVIVYLFYAWKKGFWPFPYYGYGISNLIGILKNPSFWYSLLYTILMTVFGLMAMKRWSRGWTDKYQIYRFGSLIIFQMVSFILIECIFAVFLPGDTWWRAYAVSNPFPLLFDSFYNMSGVSPTDLKWVIVGLAFLMTFVVIPIAVKWHGKRFCTWICGCGGLAETLGDRWRHLSPKGERSVRLEFQGTVMLFWAFISAGVILFIYNGDTASAGLWHGAYSLMADFWMIAVIPVALYPIYGGKIWCRYWCPLAKYMEFLSKLYCRLAITANDKCIQCTQCSKYCQVGIDVMAFAKNEAPFSNKETSCIQCGICITVCPVDVLKFENISYGDT